MRKKKISLDDFVKDTQIKLIKFAESYRKEHAKDPQSWPLELPNSNSGLWYEFFHDFVTEDN
jgi:hypothetical protein